MAAFPPLMPTDKDKLWTEVLRNSRMLRKYEARANFWFALSIPPLVISPIFFGPPNLTWHSNQQLPFSLHAFLLCFALAAIYRLKRRRCLVNLTDLQRFRLTPASDEDPIP